MTARLVAVGSVRAGHRTVTVQYADEPGWDPQPSGEEFDPDLYRKQQIEDEIAWGGL